MREHKFLLWDKNQRAFVKGNMVTINILTSLRTNNGFKLQSKYTILEYSGVDDKKGIELYEDSLVKVAYGVGRVVFHAGCFMLEWVDDPEANMELLSMDFKTGRPRPDIEYIGNMQLNYELYERLNPIKEEDGSTQL